MQRQVDGEKFQKIGTVAGAGNSTIQLSYAFADTQPLVGNNYYRLKQIDFDGNSTYSPIVVVNFDENQNSFTVKAFPNPAGGEEIGLIIQHGEGSGSVMIQVSDVSGKIVASREMGLGSDLSQQFNWKLLTPLAPGLYIIQVSSGNQRANTKLIVK